MSERKFVYPADRRNEIFREMTRNTRLNHLENQGRFLLGYYPFPRSLPRGIFQVGKDIRRGRRDDPQTIEAFFRRDGGIDLCDGHRVDRRSGFRLSLYSGGYLGFLPVALELISFGTGLFREALTKRTLFQQAMAVLSDEEQSGDEDLMPEPKIDSQYLQVFGQVFRRHIWNRELIPDSPSFITDMNDRAICESTNIVLGDSYGELEQIIERRRELRFLTDYLEALRISTERRLVNASRHICCDVGDFEACQGVASQRHEYSQAWMKHMEQFKLWSDPPMTPADLLERVDFLLVNTVVDRSPQLRRTNVEYDGVIILNNFVW